MPNYKSMRTYSKREKVVNYSTLFDKEPYEFDSSDSQTTENKQAEPAPSKVKKKVDKENKAPAKLTQTKSNKEQIPASKKTKKNVEQEVPEIKLFEISNNNSETSSRESDQTSKSQNTCSEIMNKMENIQIQQNESESSRPRRNCRTTTAARAAEALAKETATKKKRGITKSKSTSNIKNLSTKKAQMITEDPNKSDLVKQIGSIKSIIKSRSETTDDSKPKITETEKKTKGGKKAVKIIEIDAKNDQIENFKIDNRKKHAVSTSTPSGMRRRKVQVPQDFSMISTPSK